MSMSFSALVRSSRVTLAVVALIAGLAAVPMVASADTTTISFSNPLSFSTVEGLLSSVLAALQGIIVTLSLVFIVFGAVMYVLSAGDDGRMKTAKSAITAALIGLALGLAAPSFLKEIGTVLGWSDTTTSSALSLTTIATNVLNFFLSIIGILAIIMMVVGGTMYLTAAGDEDRIDEGKKIVKYSIIGIAIALAALVIVTQVVDFFA
jgi:hypothetical protein